MVGQKTAHGYQCNNSINFHNFWHVYTVGYLQLDDA